MSELRSARNRRPAGVPRLGGLGVGFLAASLMLGAGGPSRLACAQSVPPPETSYAALRWRLIGPHRGGRVLAVAGIPGDEATVKTYNGRKGGKVSLEPANPRLKTMEFDAGDVTIYGKVVTVLRRL